MVERVYEEDNKSYVEYSGNTITRKKTHYGPPNYYYVTMVDPKTGEEERVRLENAVYSWNNFS